MEHSDKDKVEEQSMNSAENEAENNSDDSSSEDSSDDDDTHKVCKHEDCDRERVGESDLSVLDPKFCYECNEGNNNGDYETRLLRKNISKPSLEKMHTSSSSAGIGASANNAKMDTDSSSTMPWITK